MKLEKLHEGRYFISEKERGMFIQIASPSRNMDSSIFRVRRSNSTILDNNKLEVRLRENPNQAVYFDAHFGASKETLSMVLRFRIPDVPMSDMYDGEDENLKDRLNKMREKSPLTAMRQGLKAVIREIISSKPNMWTHDSNTPLRSNPKTQPFYSGEEVLEIADGHEFERLTFYWKRNGR